MSRLLNALVIVCLCLALLPTLSITEAYKSPADKLGDLLFNLHPSYVPGEVIVKLRDGANLSREPGKLVRANQSSLDATLAQVGVYESAQVFPGVQRTTRYQSASPAVTSDLMLVYRLKLDTAADVMAAVGALSADPNIEYAEPNYIARAADVDAADAHRISGYSASHPLARFSSVAATTPNDPLYSQQWGLTKISAASAWDVVTGTPAVVIAVVDSGIDLTHPDLAGKLWTNPGEIPGNGIDDDNNGYVDDVNGWNFVSSSNDVSDGNGHGTQVAGVIAAATNNGVGIAGLCWNCRILPVKVMQSGIANYSDIAAGVVYAANKGAKVINLSVGGYADSATLHAAIEAASATAVIVGGAGNDGVTTPFYPAAYPDVLAVAATTDADTKANFSDYGAWVDVAAPGVAISTTLSGGDYGTASGTSLAAPFVAGLAGLLGSLHPDWSPALVHAQIVNTADSLVTSDPTYGAQLGAGRINAAMAMQAPHPLLSISDYSINGAASGRPDPNSSDSLIVSLRNDWLDATNVAGTLSTATPGIAVTRNTASFGTIASGAISNSTAFSFTVGSVGYNYPIAFTLDLSANSGTYTATFPLMATTRTGEFSVQGTITNAVWTSDKTYVVKNILYVAQGYTLTIQPGTVVKFDGNYMFDVRGTLVADGTSAQPIVFMANPGKTWDRILFNDTSADAQADGNGGYLAGSILRYVTILSSTNSIRCTFATPYLSYLSVGSGGIACIPGNTPIWLGDSAITGGVGITGTVNTSVLHNTINGGVSVALTATLSANSINGNVGIGAGLLQGNIVTGNVQAGNASQVIGNVVTAGGLSVGPGGQVLSNTLRGGSGMCIGGASELRWNTVQDAQIGIHASGYSTMTLCLQPAGFVTATDNRLIGNQVGMNITDGLIQHNLIANNAGDGLATFGVATVVSNTFTGNRGNALSVQNGTPTRIEGNNFEGNSGQYDLYAATSATTTISAPRNWWGTTDTTAIADRIYDFSDNPDKPQVSVDPVLTAPVQDAPAYVRQVTVSPDKTLGIQTGTFDVLFSQPMDVSGVSAMDFHTIRKGTWRTYNSANSGLPPATVNAMMLDPVGNTWFGTYGGASVLHADGSWQTYDTSNSGLAANYVTALAVDATNAKWFGTGSGVSVLHSNGSWQTYNTANSGLAGNLVLAVAVDTSGAKWFGTGGAGVSVLRADGSWQTYNASNSGLTGNVRAIAVDTTGVRWFGTDAGVRVLHADASWQTYNTSNSGLVSNAVQTIVVDAAQGKWFGTAYGASVLRADGSWQTYFVGDSIQAIAVDAAGAKWFGTNTGVSVLHADGSLQAYDASNSGLPNGYVNAIAVDAVGNAWFGMSSLDGVVGVLWGGLDYAIADNTQWLPPTNRYRATYDFTSLIPRGAYSLTVSGARGTDGIEIAPYSGVTFTVDYAGSINDTTPPPAPSVSVDFCRNSTTSAYASWSAYDPNSAITLYRYALGSTPNGTDVINWIDTSATSVTRTGLNLVTGQRYYFSVRARNAGGLWSVASFGGFTAGVPCSKIYLPIVVKSP